MIVPIAPGCELRPLTMDDAEAMMAAIDANRERLREWLPWLDRSRTMEDAHTFLKTTVQDNENRAALSLSIRIDGRFAGAISLHKIDLAHRNTSIGYWISEEFVGRGLMTQCCRAIVFIGFQEYGLHRIEIRCASGNHRSAAIAQRLGFIEEGTMREAEWLYDRWVDLRVFAMLEQHWKS